MKTPPPMDRSGWESPHAHVEPHDHAVLVYRTDAELLGPLASFIEDGVRQRQLIVFVHSFPTDEEAWRFLARAIVRADASLRDVVLVRVHQEAFEGGGGRIDYEHVGRVVDSLGQLAGSRGLDAVRIFVDASRQYLSTGREEEWFRFEEWLGRRLQAAVGLVCAYREEDALRADLFPRVLQAHAYRFGPAAS